MKRWNVVVLESGALKSISVIALTMLFAGQSFSQSIRTNAVSKAKISELGFIVGDWKGTGWSLFGPDGKMVDYEHRVHYEHAEKVRFKLDSTAILLEARYEYAGGITAENLSVLTYDKKDGNYSFRGYGQGGEYYELEAELIEGKFYIYPGENTRMVISINEKGQWYEKAEHKSGNDWVVVDEMTLNREE